jgi:hypothetical protein
VIESIPSDTDVQDKVFAFLANPAAHPGLDAGETEGSLR